MNIAALTISYPNLSEQFVARELDGLAARGHNVRVFTKRDPAGPLTPATDLTVEPWTDANVHAFAPDVLYASLGFPAHRRAHELSLMLRKPAAYRVWQGYDAFTDPNPGFYGPVSRNTLTRGVIVEDAWMDGYARREMAVERCEVIPNGVDVEVFRPRRHVQSPIRVLALSRWVLKKGLRHLAAAWRALRPQNAELHIVGYGPEEENLRAAAGLNTGVSFLPPIAPEHLPATYQSADIFVAPCIAPKGGDADGVPTTLLEAMSCGLAVIASDLHSAPLYVEHEASGLLVKPGDEAGIAEALRRLIGDAELRRRLGAGAREAAVKGWALSESITKLEGVLGGGQVHRTGRADG